MQVHIENNSVEITEILADGFIEIDGKYKEFEDIHVATHGYDHFPPG